METAGQRWAWLSRAAFLRRAPISGYAECSLSFFGALQQLVRAQDPPLRVCPPWRRRGWCRSSTVASTRALRNRDRDHPAPAPCRPPLYAR